MGGITEAEVVELVRAALLAADELGLDDAGLHLNDALIALTGAGIAPKDLVSTQVH